MDYLQKPVTCSKCLVHLSKVSILMNTSVPSSLCHCCLSRELTLCPSWRFGERLQRDFVWSMCAISPILIAASPHDVCQHKAEAIKGSRQHNRISFLFSNPSPLRILHSNLLTPGPLLLFLTPPPKPRLQHTGAGLLEQPLARQDTKAYPCLHQRKFKVPPRHPPIVRPWGKNGPPAVFYSALWQSSNRFSASIKAILIHLFWCHF